MKKSFTGRPKEQGWTLLEFGIVLVMLAIFVAIVLGNSKSTSASRKNTTEVQSMAMLISNAKGLKSGGSYGANVDLIPILITTKQVPGNITVVGGNTLNNQWAQAIDVVGNNAQLQVTDQGVPLESCQALVTGVGNGDSTITVTVGGTAAVATNGIISPQAAQTACGNADPVVVQFTTNS